jgi:hypothetical protein
MEQSPAVEIVVRQPFKFLAFHGICKLIAVFKRARHLSVYSTRRIQPTFLDLECGLRL